MHLYLREIALSRRFGSPHPEAGERERREKGEFGLGGGEVKSWDVEQTDVFFFGIDLEEVVKTVE